MSTPRHAAALCGALLAVLLGGANGGCSSGNDPSQNRDLCTTPDTASLDDLVAGPSRGTFVSYGDNPHAEITFGSQGALMLTYRLRAVGDSPPRCLGHMATLIDSEGIFLGESRVSLATTRVDSTTRETALAFIVLPGYWTDTMTFFVEAGGLSREYALTADGPDMDASVLDAGR